MELLYYYKKPLSKSEAAAINYLPMPVASLQYLRSSDTDFRKEEGSLFETAASAFSMLVKDLENRVLMEIIAQAKAKCHKYRAER